MKGKLVAKRYAKALFNIARADDTIEDTGNELRNLADLFEDHPRLKEALWNPFFGKAPRKAIVEEVAKLAGFSKNTVGFLLLLLEKERINLFDAILQSYRDFEDVHAGRLRAEVVSVEPLGEDELRNISELLSNIHNKEIVIEASRDEGIIGGIICKIGSVVYDGSIRNQLEKIKEQMRYN